MGLAALLLMTGCADENLTTTNGREQQANDADGVTGTPVLFTVGNLNQSATTRADVIPYMAEGGRFVCTMYYHSGKNDTDSTDFDIKHPTDGGTMSTAWLQVNNDMGNSVYRKNTFATPSEDDLDTYKFDKNATNFYWHNRLQHAFLALTDYNTLKTIDGDTTSTKVNKLKMYPHYDKDMVPALGENSTHEDSVTYANTLGDNRYANSYDLRRTAGMDTIADQLDILQALTIMKPAGATQEANRVRLYFKHQFAQVQVNIKASDDNSTEITTEQIDSVELLGVSEEAYVFCRINADPKGKVGATLYKEVVKESYTDEQLEANPWGTSFKMFDMVRTNYKIDEDGDGIDDRYADGYLKSFNAIAFGYLWAIRISWHEQAETVGGKHIEHVSTYEVPQNSGEASGNIPLRQMQSGRKYIYNLELRRGTLAVIRTQIVDWNQDENLVYSVDGTITN